MPCDRCINVTNVYVYQQIIRHAALVPVIDEVLEEASPLLLSAAPMFGLYEKTNHHRYYVGHAFLLSQRSTGGGDGV